MFKDLLTLVTNKTEELVKLLAPIQTEKYIELEKSSFTTETKLSDTSFKFRMTF